MYSRKSSSRDAGSRDWVETTLHGDALQVPPGISRQQSVGTMHDSTAELHAGLDFRELDTLPAEFLDLLP